MRHQVGGRRLNRHGAHRKALYRNLVTDLVKHERIKTTVAKAKEIRKWADKMIALGKKGTPFAFKQAASFIRTIPEVKKVFSELAPRSVIQPLHTQF